MEKIREEIIFSGRVQGVGFRYKACHLARHFDMTGWVKNEYDGTVIGQFQGRECDIDMVIRRLMQDDYIRIDSVSRRKLPLQEERGFSISG